MRKAIKMGNHALLAVAGSMLAAPVPRAQATPASAAPIPEEARSHFVMGETIFKEAKSPENFSQAAAEFTEATQLAPQWPDARYNLALAKEAAGDYAGAIADLKIYQQFNLPDADARSAQDKIYEIEAKQKMANDPATKERNEAEQTRKAVEQENLDFAGLFQKLDGAFYAGEYPDGGVVYRYEIRIHRSGPFNAMGCDVRMEDNSEQ